jgi:hypothetical protein
MIPRVVNRHHYKGARRFRLQNPISIERPSKWGNPYVIGIDGDRATVVRKHKEWFPRQERLVKALAELDGANLVCSCKPRLCHGDNLVEFFKEFVCGGR